MAPTQNMQVTFQKYSMSSLKQKQIESLHFPTSIDLALPALNSASIQNQVSSLHCHTKGLLRNQSKVLIISFKVSGFPPWTHKDYQTNYNTCIHMTFTTFNFGLASFKKTMYTSVYVSYNEKHEEPGLGRQQKKILTPLRQLRINPNCKTLSLLLMV